MQNDMLLHSTLLRYVQDELTAQQYEFLSKNWTQDWYCLDDQSVIAPMHFNVLPQDVRKVIRWINEKILLNLPSFTWFPYTKTMGVLLRIATGMINKLDLPKDTKREMHLNMIENIQKEQRVLDLESLPF